MSMVIMKALMGFHEEWKVILYNSAGFPTMSTYKLLICLIQYNWRECDWNIMATTGAKEGER